MKRTIQFAVAIAVSALFSTAQASVVTLDLGTAGSAAAPAASYQSFVNASNAGAVNIDSAAYEVQALDADWASNAGDVAGHSASAAMAIATASAPAVPVSPVPEPGIYAMLLIGLGLLGFTTRREQSDKFSV